MSTSYRIKDGQSLRGFLNSVILEATSKRRIMEKDDSALASGEISVEDVIDKLNIIRSGRSFKDEDVLSGMQDYLEDLDSAEKTALLAFLKGISEIVTAGVKGEEAFEPSENPAKVKMEKSSSKKQKVTIKPNVIKKPDQKSKSSPSKSEDTTPPAPIEPKKK